MEWIQENLTLVITAIAGLLGIGLTIKIVLKRSKSTTTTDQSGSIVGGDQVGRDKKS